jgi:hypothetical protein
LEGQNEGENLGYKMRTTFDEEINNNDEYHGHNLIPGLNYNKFNHTLNSYYLPTVAESVEEVILDTIPVIEYPSRKKPSHNNDNFGEKNDGNNNNSNPQISQTKSTTHRPKTSSFRSTPYNQSYPALSSLDKGTLTDMLEFYRRTDGKDGKFGNDNSSFEKFLFSTQCTLIQARKDHYIETLENCFHQVPQTNPQNVDNHRAGQNLTKKNNEKGFKKSSLLRAKLKTVHRSLYSFDDCLDMMSYMTFLVRNNNNNNINNSKNQNNDSNLAQLIQILPIFITYSSTSSMTHEFVSSFINNIFTELLMPLVGVSIDSNGHIINPSQVDIISNFNQNNHNQNNSTKLGYRRMTSGQIQTRIDLIINLFASVTTLPIYSKFNSSIDDEIDLSTKISQTEPNIHNFRKNSHNKSINEGISLPTTDDIENAFKAQYYMPSEEIFYSLLKLLTFDAKNNIENDDNNYQKNIIQSYNLNNDNSVVDVNDNLPCATMDSALKFAKILQKVIKNTQNNQQNGVKDAITGYFNIWQDIVCENYLNENVMSRIEQEYGSFEEFDGDFEPNLDIKSKKVEIMKAIAIQTMFQDIITQPHILAKPTNKKELLIVVGLGLFKTMNKFK